MDAIGFIIGVAVGVLDEITEGQTVQGLPLPLQDVSRFGLFIGGLAADFLGRGTIKEIGEKIEAASLPLVVKSASKMIKAKTYRPPRPVAAHAPAATPRATVSVSSY